MPSTIAWLDANREDQQRMREVISFFSDSESRDELGIGQVRDAFSDVLFPGTSSLQTRARYLLLVPWCYLDAARLATSGPDLERRVDALERRLITELLRAPDTTGVIGNRAGTKVRTLPSTIYWSALERFGIRVGTVADQLAARRWSPETEELAGTRPQMWNCLPVPSGFPDTQDSLDLTPDEAAHLKDRVVAGAPSTLLAYLLLEGVDVHAHVAPWDAPLDNAVLAEQVHHARLFSHVVHGASLTYNALLARAQVDADIDGGEANVEHYDGALESWHEQHHQLASTVRAWDLDALWTLVCGKNPRISPVTRRFVEQWVERVRDDEIVGSTAAELLVGRRERSVKGKQSRLANQRLLRSWSGAAGTRPLRYRWPTVQTVVGDIQEGLDRARS